MCARYRRAAPMPRAAAAAPRRPAEPRARHRSLSPVANGTPAASRGSPLVQTFYGRSTNKTGCQERLERARGTKLAYARLLLLLPILSLSHLMSQPR